MTGSNGPRTLPLRLAPVPGEALDSWLDALAHRLKVPLADLCRAIGLKGGPHSVYKRDDIPANRVVLLRDPEAEAISAATGIAVSDLHAMTLARYNQRAILIDHATRRVNNHAMWARGRGSRYCPDCLAISGGRWQLRWRLPWSFACTAHARLLAEACPSCERDHSFAASQTHLPPTPGRCASPVPLPGQGDRTGRRVRHTRCDTDLATAVTLLLPADHSVLRAQQVLDELIDTDIAAFGLYGPEPQPTFKAFADLRAIAGRVVASTLRYGLPTSLAHDPVAVELHQQAVRDLGRVRHPVAQNRIGTVAPPLAGAALGLAHACALMLHPDVSAAGESLRWLMTTLPGPQRRPTHASTIDDWGRHISDTFRRVQLTALGPGMRPNDQLRYRTGTTSPAVHLDRTGTIARSRASRLPAVFWPTWTARLLPPGTGFVSVRGPSLAAILLLIGTRLNHDEAAELLGRVAPGSAVTTTQQRLHRSEHWADICTAFIRLADYLDTQPVLVDYERRRQLDYSALLPSAQWAAICARSAYDKTQEVRRRQHALAQNLLFTQLACLPAVNAPFDRTGTDAQFQIRRTRFIVSLTPRLAAELRQAADAFLNSQGIQDEPALWQPPQHLLDGLDLPGTDHAAFDLARIHHLVRAESASCAAIAREMDTTTEAIESILLEHPAPQTELTAGYYVRLGKNYVSSTTSSACLGAGHWSNHYA
ncbi:TniQ family protein [Streptomyces globisporus]